MTSSSTTTALAEELWKHFGSTPGCDDLFIEQCVEICRDFNVSPNDLYFKWESIILAPNAIGMRFVDNTTPSAIKSVIRSELSRAALARPSRLNRACGSKSCPHGNARSWFSDEITGVGLVDPTPNLQSSSAIPRVGKVGTSKIVFECHDIEDVSRDKRNYKFMHEKISERWGLSMTA
ncbi:hypothetical protein BJV77DRAFT_52790 [Russula vinacea]|nr:hypothetical protein BJV77DRAFT_52790 [Russula vinacea]